MSNLDTPFYPHVAELTALVGPGAAKVISEEMMIAEFDRRDNEARRAGKKRQRDEESRRKLIRKINADFWPWPDHMTEPPAGTWEEDTWAIGPVRVWYSKVGDYLMMQIDDDDYSPTRVDTAAQFGAALLGCMERARNRTALDAAAAAEAQRLAALPRFLCVIVETADRVHAALNANATDGYRLAQPVTVTAGGKYLIVLERQPEQAE